MRLEGWSSGVSISASWSSVRHIRPFDGTDVLDVCTRSGRYEGGTRGGVGIPRLRARFSASLEVRLSKLGISAGLRSLWKEGMGRDDFSSAMGIIESSNGEVGGLSRIDLVHRIETCDVPPSPSNEKLILKYLVNNNFTFNLYLHSYWRCIRQTKEPSQDMIACFVDRNKLLSMGIGCVCSNVSLGARNLHLEDMKLDGRRNMTYRY